MRLTVAIAFTLLFFSSCVTSRKYQDLETEKNKLRSQAYDLQKQVDSYEAQVDALKGRQKEMEASIRRLRTDSTDINRRYDLAEKTNEDLRNVEAVLNDRVNQMLQLQSNENRDLGLKLANLENELLRQKNEQNDKERKLEDLEKDLAKREAEIEQLNAELVLREQKVNDLENLINEKERQLEQLKNDLTNALTGFDEYGLSIEQRDGKVYVSLSEKLLFKTGSIDVDSKGREALEKLAEVISGDQRFDVIIEGHTDNVPMKGSGQIKDNWDLSVLRATSIVRILQQNGLAPERISASGRGEYAPMNENSTAEERAQNRRTEIILFPKLNDVLKLLRNY